MANKRKNWLYAMIGTALVVLVGYQVLNPATIAVDVGRVERGVLQVTVEEQGRTRAMHRFTVAAPVTGRVLRTTLDEGDRVEAGDVLVTIAPPPENARVQAAERAQVTAAQARQRESEARLAESTTNYQQAQREAQRRNDLYERGLVSMEERDAYQRTSDAAQARLQSSQAALAAARADVETAQSRLLGTNDGASDDAIVAIRAPVSGCVLRVHEESERVVQAGSPLFELCEGEVLELIIDLLTEDAVKVHPGDRILVTGWGGPSVLEGKVRHVEPGAFTKVSTLGVEEQRVNVIGDLLEPPAELGAEYRIEAAIVVWEGDDVLSIPTSALFRRGGSWHTFVVEDGRARLRAIDIGQRGTERAQVLAGAQEGDGVIEFPSDIIEDGVRVEAGS